MLIPPSNVSTRRGDIYHSTHVDYFFAPLDGPYYFQCSYQDSYVNIRLVCGRILKGPDGKESYAPPTAAVINPYHNTPKVVCVEVEPFAQFTVNKLVMHDTTPYYYQSNRTYWPIVEYSMQLNTPQGWGAKVDFRDHLPPLTTGYQGVLKTVSENNQFNGFSAEVACLLPKSLINLRQTYTENQMFRFSQFARNLELDTSVVWNQVLAMYPWDKRDTSSVKSLEVKQPIAGHVEKLAVEHPTLLQFLSLLHSGKTVNKTTNNQLLSAFYTSIGDDYTAFVDKLAEGYAHFTEGLVVNYRYGHTLQHVVTDTRTVLLTFPGSAEKVEAKKAQKQWQFAKTALSKAEILGISPEKHPTLTKCLADNEITFSLFHEAGKENNLINCEFDIIEEALSQPGWKDIVVSIMVNAAKRSTYSKRVTNYLAFLLYVLPAYLDRNAPLKPKGKSKKKRSWSCMPKFVNSQWELEMRDEDTVEGTTKKRSALTPLADNETGVVTVPYAAMAVSGIRTTWCYSEMYSVIEKGREDTISAIGGTYPSDVAEKLNGRDDYGLCFYTLTGTSRNQGYPTFLIILERTTDHGTRVHFHRVHPCRARGPEGTPTPPHKLIEECYRYMAGNVKASEIAHQQGDLLLLACNGPGKAVDPAVDVFGFENHQFVSKSDTPVQLVKATGKTRGNTLGWLYSDQGMNMPHPEHEPINNIPAGWYELKRCKSYENNPSGVWSLNID